MKEEEKEFIKAVKMDQKEVVEYLLRKYPDIC